jgi:magnesium chelatase subunit I
MNETQMASIRTLGDLKAAGYQPKSIKHELRANLVERLRNRQKVFEGILGYDDTVIPDIQRALLARHNMILLGLRGQAKTRMARLMVELLDEYMPVVEGSEVNDDPLRPLSKYARDMVAEKGDDTPIAFVHRSERYAEKLATPDVTVADLIGDIDPIKAANLKLSFSDERVLNYGIVPRSNRSIFVINELPDLQPRIQVALFNILQEGDIQIRGFKVRLPLDIQFVFTANPEDYTNRGSIVTPLKDRIQSQILTHYPQSIQLSKQITQQEAKVEPDQRKAVQVSDLMNNLLEQAAFEARDSEYIDSKSGVSARLTITAYENLVSEAERRILANGEARTVTRIGDLFGVVPSITGKVELVYEGEQEGPRNVALNLIGKAIREQFPHYFPNPDQYKRQKDESPYRPMLDWFGAGNELDLQRDLSDKDFAAELSRVSGLRNFVKRHYPNLNEKEQAVYMEFILHGLAEYSLLSKQLLDTSQKFGDILTSVFGSGSDLSDLE